MALHRTINGGYYELYLRSVPVKVPSAQSVIAIITLMQSLALSTSCVRLIHRTYIRKLWWDDFWAAVAFLCDLVLFITFLIVTRTGTLHHLSAFSRWITLLTYTTTLWTSRLTISVAITRLLPEGRVRRLSKAVSVAFGIFLTSLVLQKVFFCRTNWHEQRQCTIPRYTDILELVTDILADLWLLLAPAHMLWHMKLRRVHRRLIFAIFACDVLTMLASITHSVFIFIVSPAGVGISGFIQVNIALIVSNLLVLVTAVYRVLRRRARTAGTTTIPRSSTASSSSNSSNRNVSGRRTDATSAAPNTTTEYISHISLTQISGFHFRSTTSYPRTLGAGEVQQGKESAVHTAVGREA